VNWSGCKGRDGNSVYRLWEEFLKSQDALQKGESVQMSLEITIREYVTK